MPPRAFTLIELMAVVLLLGLLAGAVAWSLAENVEAAGRADAVGRVVQADCLARMAARRLGRPSVLRIDLEAQRLWRVTPAPGGPAGPGAETSHPVDVPAGYRIDRVAVADAAATRDAGIVEIAYSTGGRSASYALRLVRADRDETPAGADAPGPWLVVAGLTGHVSLNHDEADVDNLLALLAAGRPDAR